MHALISRTTSRITKPSSARSCRLIAGRRYPSSIRRFRVPSHLRKPQDDPANKAELAEPAWNRVQEVSDKLQAEQGGEVEEHITDTAETTTVTGQESESIDDPEAGPEKLIKTKDKSNYGSAIRRAVRNRKAKEVMRIEIPGWFLERNVQLYKPPPGGEKPKANDFAYAQHLSGSVTKLRMRKGPRKPTSPIVDKDNAGEETLEDTDTYEIDRAVLGEISTMISAGLQPSTRHEESSLTSRPHILLQSPKDGGIFFLDAVVKHLARSHETDLISFDAQDITEIAGQFASDFPGHAENIRSLSYDTHLMMARQDPKARDDDDVEDDEYDEGEEEQDYQTRSKQPVASTSHRSSAIPIYVSLGSLKVADLMQSAKGLSKLLPMDPSRIPRGSQPHTQSSESSEQVKINHVFEAFLDAAYLKHALTLEDSGPEDAKELDANPLITQQNGSATLQEDRTTALGNAPKNVIVLIRDYPEMNATPLGGAILSKLHEIVRARRKEGVKILVIGTTSSQDLLPSISKAGIKALESEAGHGPYRTIITPCRTSSTSFIFASDEKIRTQMINIRHLQQMLQRLSPTPEHSDSVIMQRNLGALSSMKDLTPRIDEYLWPFERVYRIVTLALGMLQDDLESTELSSTHIIQAMDIMESSDEAKFSWVAQEKEGEKQFRIELGWTRDTSSVKSDTEERMKKLRKLCNTHEKKLLSGVVDAANIKTTFADVRAPAEIIEALKTLTSLSLVRPEAFTYGVLATDKIPGLLLYGPPGTGKTLLAKAVAKESGATVLEISGSDVYDMYVGEGEKNVRAIFSLAKKLSPCVVFIDEADAIFGARSSFSSRTSHRELINQFLREWDGMNDLSAFLMVATNRPFDLDDAVLRRLPRRLLVDLPTEKDREAILAIHLKDEILDKSVSLSTLADSTPFYSGSDLKNLSVAAALACVREENDAATAAAGTNPGEPHKFPDKRTLSKRHFDRAMEEISASISEDMSSLTAIRKFDEKFGDRRGRKKKGSGWGFGTVTEQERAKEDTVRVRQQV